MQVFHLLDVTQNREARKNIHFTPALSDALLACGFYPVGLLEIKIPDELMTKSQMKWGAGTDAWFVRRVTTQGEVNEVLASPDRGAYAVVSRYFC